MRLQDLRPLSLFDGLSDDQLTELIEVGAEATFVPGQILFVEGEPADSWWVLVEGSIDLLRHVGREESVLGRMDSPGRWAGGFRAWDDHGAYLATGRGKTAGRVLCVPAAALRDRAVAWFPFGAHLIDGLFHTARNIEATARQKEALVALGTLAAGLAHELNNPAAAAARAVESLAATCDTLLDSLTHLASASISADQFAALDALRREITPPVAASGPMALADKEDALSDWLSGRGLGSDWTIAPGLAAAGVDIGWCERVAGTVGGPALEPALEWVVSTLSATALLREVKESTRRISELVSAVKTYSQLDRASTHATDVTEGIESTLTMLAHRIPPGIAVVRDYGTGVPRIEAAAGELNQVWTNLIDNAIDAMAGGGTLTVSTQPDGAGVVVEIGDTGAGMSRETRAHAFEPFFTTKGVGKGTGLGLDISRRIVDRHGGDIDIQSRPGETVLRVRLPAQPPAASP